MGTQKQTDAIKKQWANRTPEQRKAIMDKVMAGRWKNTTKEERSAHASKMGKLRWTAK